MRANLPQSSSSDDSSYHPPSQPLRSSPQGSSDDPSLEESVSLDTTNNPTTLLQESHGDEMPIEPLREVIAKFSDDLWRQKQELEMFERGYERGEWVEEDDQISKDIKGYSSGLQKVGDGFQKKIEKFIKASDLAEDKRDQDYDEKALQNYLKIRDPSLPAPQLTQRPQSLSAFLTADKHLSHDYYARYDTYLSLKAQSGRMRSLLDVGTLDPWDVLDPLTAQLTDKEQKRYADYDIRLGDHLKRYVIDGGGDHERIRQGVLAVVMRQVFRKKKRTLVGGIIGRGYSLQVDIDDMSRQAKQMVGECLMRIDQNTNLGA
ncbi:hypothetical protein FGO68_gene7248 [Halteria grandinella]|uniref:Uncharacterized protein n=1 Tax=Halteria grandinella TaxID=5974 RepID=A0A8J8NKU5_HALGN|nr:hypothetical protein FGO68_gene7248 [Halteria grandinella]